MGLLDLFSTSDPTQREANLALAAGLLSGSFGRGVAGYGGVMSQAPDREMRRQLVQSQIDENAAQVDVRKQAAAELLRKIAREKQLQDLAAQFSINPEQARARSAPGRAGRTDPRIEGRRQALHIAAFR